MKTQRVRNVAQGQPRVLEETSRKTVDSQSKALAWKSYYSQPSHPDRSGGEKMTDNFCTSIIQLDPNICSVTRSAGQLLENAQRCQFEDESAPIVNEEPSLLRFRVRDLTERYQYELTSDPSHYQLTFSMNEDHLTILVRNRQIDVVNLVDRIARLSYRNQSASAITRTQRSSEANCRTPIPVLQQATAV